MPASPIRKLYPYALGAKNRGIHVYHLNIGQPDIHTPKPIFDAIRNHTDPVLSYGPSQGLEGFRQSLVDYYRKSGHHVDIEDLFVTTGGSEAIVITLMAICDPGDEVLVPEPFYTNYAGFTQMAGVRPVPVPTKVEEGFHLPSEKEFETLITPRTRAILYCSPNNPTGTIFTREEVERLARIAQKNNLYLLADEVYREFVFDGKVHTSLFEIPGMEDRGIVLDSFSKRFSVCGARIGCIVSRNHDLWNIILRFGQARLCPPTLGQIGVMAGIEAMDQFMEEMICEFQKRRDVVYDALQDIQSQTGTPMPPKRTGILPVHKPEGAFYVMAQLPVDDADAFAQWLLTDFNLNHKTTMVAPGSGFYSTPGKGVQEVRIAYVLNENDLREAMEVLKEGVEVYNRK
jgi:aspartate aminotransferase